MFTRAPAHGCRGAVYARFGRQSTRIKWSPRPASKRGRFATDLRLLSDRLSGASLVLRCTYRPGGPRVGIRTQKLVGGPGFEPGASRSRTVAGTCPQVSDRLRCRPRPFETPPACVLFLPAKTLPFPGHS